MRVKDYQSGYDIKSLISKIQTPKSQPITIGPPIVGLNFRLKPSQIDNNETPYCKNARITRNYIEPRPGLTLISSSFDSTIMYIREFKTSTDLIFKIVITTKSIYYSTNLVTYTRLPWYYATGTVTTQVASKVVTGLGTSWLTNARVGDKFKCNADSTWGTIASVDSDTQITLSANYGVANSGVAYKIDRYFGGTTDNAFWAVTIADFDYFTFSQGIDPVLYLDANMDQVRRLSADCPAATFGILYADRLIIGGLTNLGFRIQYCVRGTYTDWTGVGSGFKDWIDDPYGVTGMTVFAGALAVYKSYSISLMTETGVSDSPFNYATKVPGVGLYYAGIFFGIGDNDVIGGSDNFYTYNGVNLKSLGDNVKDRFLSIIEPSYAHKSHSLVIEAVGEGQIFFPTADNTTPNKVWLYNYDMDIWASEWDLAATASGYATQVLTESWDQATGTWDTDTAEWDSVEILASTPLNLIGNGTSLYKEDSNALDDDGVDFIFEWWTKEFELASNQTIAITRVVVDYYCSVESTLKCSLSGDGGQIFTDEVNVDLTYSSPSKMKRAFFDFIQTFDTLLARFRCIDGGRFQIVKVSIESVPLGDIIPNV